MIFPILLSLFFLILQQHCADCQQERPPAPQLDPLGQVVFTALDVNHDNKVSMAEVTEQLAMLEQLFTSQGGLDQEEDPEIKEYITIFKYLREILPQLFVLFDQDQDQFLSSFEMEMLTEVHESIRNRTMGEFKPLVRELFVFLDINNDDQLSEKEWLDAKNGMTEITRRIHRLFPFRPTALEMKPLLESLFYGINVDDKKSIKDEKFEKVARQALEFLDENGDKIIKRTEFGKAYQVIIAKKFLKIAKEIQQFGPMLAMMSGAGSFGAATAKESASPSIDGTLREF